MIDHEAFLKVSYGLYIVCTGNMEFQNGFICNSFFQVTSEPPQFTACCNKENHTAALIQEYGVFTVSVLAESAPVDLIRKFGYRSGRDIRKFEDVDFIAGKLGAPVVKSGCMAYLECKLVNTFDAGTHRMFVGEALHAGVLDAGAVPMTYNYYRDVKKGIAPKNAPTYIDRKLLLKAKGSDEKP